jgi:hypothetical protein
MKIVFLLFFSIFILLAKDIEKSESSFFNDLMDEVTSTLDANISDQMKLENMQEYFKYRV